MTETMDYKSIVGAIFLGVNGVVVKGHGNSDAYAFEHALKVAESLSSYHLAEKIQEELAKDA